MGDWPKRRRQVAAAAALCVLAGTPLAYVMLRTDGGQRGHLLPRLALVVALTTVPTFVGRWRAKRDAARTEPPSPHRLTGVGMRDALAVVIGVVFLGLGVVGLLVEPATGDGLNPAIPFVIGALLIVGGIADGRRQRR